MAELTIPPQLKIVTLSGEENYMYWAIYWYAHLNNIPGQLDYLFANHNQQLLLLLLSTIDESVIRRLKTYHLTSNSLWQALEGLYGPGVKKEA